MHRVLVVDDEADLTALVAYHLARSGYGVSTAGGGREALAMALEERPDAVVLDLMLPDLPGFTVLSELRRRPETREMGVLLLTARREEADRIRGFALGADDYLAKPFSPAELVLRVGAILRRVSTAAALTRGRLSAGPLVVDSTAHRVTVNGTELELTPTEFRLLRTLVERQGRVQSRAQLLEMVWHAQPDVRTRTVDMHLQRLRRKLGALGEYIETVRGAGYRFRRTESQETNTPGPTAPRG
jgi:two-component system, OmpR family, phosphate regulon response regulator PhoB